jgi:hypothetical protein
MSTTTVAAIGAATSTPPVDDGDLVIPTTTGWLASR